MKEAEKIKSDRLSFPVTGMTRAPLREPPASSGLMWAQAHVLGPCGLSSNNGPGLTLQYKGRTFHIICAHGDVKLGPEPNWKDLFPMKFSYSIDIKKND